MEAEPVPTPASTEPSRGRQGQETSDGGSSTNNSPDASSLFHALRVEVKQQRSRSPYYHPHSRSHSAVAALSAPSMTRAHSLPMYETRQRLESSPSRSPVRPSSPLRTVVGPRPGQIRSFEDGRSQLLLPPSFTDIESIAEDSELHIKPTASRRGTALDPAISFQPAYMPSRGNSTVRRAPASPLQQNSSLAYARAGPPPSPSTASAATLASPPSPPASRFDEMYPSGLSIPAPSATSSMPSTPTSFRSRSPSISSLETIPDSPMAEAEAAEAYTILRLKAAADAADLEEERRSARQPSGRASVDAAKRKRWSVCGAERRGDFEMETIWED